MLRRIAKSLRPCLAAFVALLVLVAALELLLRYTDVPFSVVTARTAAQYQGVLTASEKYHHDLRRSVRMVVHHSADRDIEVRTNLLGCRGEPIRRALTENDYRILILGDETVFGAGVPETSTLPVRLKDRMQRHTALRLEVINGGVPGFSPLLSRLRYEHLLSALKPQLVILHVDLSDAADEASFRSFLTDDGGKEYCRHPFGIMKPVTSVFGQTVQRSALLNRLLSGLRQQAPGILSIRGEACDCYEYEWLSRSPGDRNLQTAHLLDSITRLRRSVEESRAQLLVTTCPVRWQLHDCSGNPELLQRCGIKGNTPSLNMAPFLLLADHCEQHGIRFLNSLDDFQSRAESHECFDERFPVLSEQGQILYAGSIADFLIKNPPREW